MKRTVLITIAVLGVFTLWSFTMVASAAVGYSAAKDSQRRTDQKFACVGENIASSTPTTRAC